MNNKFQILIIFIIIKDINYYKIILMKYNMNNKRNINRININRIII